MQILKNSTLVVAMTFSSISFAGKNPWQSFKPKDLKDFSFRNHLVDKKEIRIAGADKVVLQGKVVGISYANENGIGIIIDTRRGRTVWEYSFTQASQEISSLHFRHTPEAFKPVDLGEIQKRADCHSRWGHGFNGPCLAK